MHKLNKRYTHIEYIKMLLDNGGVNKCMFCKYNWRNYRYSDVTLRNMAMEHFMKRCSSCVNTYTYIKLSKEEQNQKYWFSDLFKPLYDWEEGEENE